MQVTKQVCDGLTLLSGYQWSKGIDNVAETEPGLGSAGDSFRNSKDISIERSLSAHDTPHSWVTSLVYDLPVGKGRRFGSGLHPVADLLLGGWQVSSVVRFASGLPVRMTAPSTVSQYGFGGQIPNISNASAVKLPGRTPDAWFDRAAFSAPPPYTVGTAPRRITELRAAGVKHADLAVMKNSPIRQRFRLQFRGECFNLTNTPQFGRPDTALGSQTFGKVSGTRNIPPCNVRWD